MGFGWEQGYVNVLGFLGEGQSEEAGGEGEVGALGDSEGLGLDSCGGGDPGGGRA